MLHTYDSWERAIGTFLADLTGPTSRPAAASASMEVEPSIPVELSDLPGAAARILARLAIDGDDAVRRYPSIDRALHEVLIAEVLADRLERRAPDPPALDPLVDMVAATLDYFAELAATSLEGEPVTHGLVIASTCERSPKAGAVVYPGRLPTRKRTPLLFDGTQSTLVVDMCGYVVRGVERTSLPAADSSSASLRAFDELPGIEGGLTAAASASFRGIGIYLRSDRSIVVFDEGTLLFVRRGLRWRSVAFESFATTVAALGATTDQIGQRVARTALRLSMQGHGAILAIAQCPADLDDVIQHKDRAPSDRDEPPGDVDADLARLLQLPDVASASGLARLARLDGATVIDLAGNVIAYGAVVRSSDSQAEGARAAAARTLSTAVEIAISVSHDGPITVYRHGAPVLELL